MSEPAPFGGSDAAPARTHAERTLEALDAVLDTLDAELDAADRRRAAIRRSRHLATEVHRRTQDALRESERRFRDFTESASDWCWEMDAELRFTFVSERIEEVCGIPAERFIGRRRDELPESARGGDANHWAEVREIVERRRSYRDLLVRYRLADGGERVLRTSAKAIRGEDGAFLGYRGTGTDVTEEFEADSRARAAERRLAEALSLVADGYALFDPDDRLVMCNDMYRYRFNPMIADVIRPGASYEEILRAACGHGLVELESDAIEEWIRWRLDAHREPTEAIELRRGDGQWHRMREHRGPDGYTVLVISDVTEHHRARLELERQNKLLETVIDCIPDALAIVDTERVIRMVNPALVRLFGHRAGDLVGRSTRVLYASDEEHARLGREHFNLDMPERRAPLVGRFRRASGETFPAETVGALVREPDGRVTGWLGLMRDVTEREALEAQLRQSRKMQAIGQLTGGIAHDFNNILASVLGYASLALERQVGDPASKLAGYLREIQRAGERGRALVAQLLTFSRGGSAPARRIELAPAIDEAVRLLRPTLPSTIALEVHAAPETAGVLLDPVQAQQLVMNLCINARDAMPDGGTIRIAVGPACLRAARCSACHEALDAEFVELRVEDTGAGIAPGILERIFDPFFSTKDAGVGAGMGLSVVHGILHRNAGHVLVESEQGRGTRFRLLLPPLDGAPAACEEAPARAPAEPLAAPRRGLRVLVVDDEAAVAGYVADLLEAYGYRPDTFTDSAAALERLETEPDGYAVLVTDQTMPGMAGAELARRARAVRPGLPVVLCTGYSDAVDARTVAAWGASRYLAKPAAPRDLLDAVREVLREREEAGA